MDNPNISRGELCKRLEVARLALGLAHLPVFGLVLFSGQRGPFCTLCGGEDAPIVDGRHLPHEGDESYFCKMDRTSAKEKSKNVQLPRL